MAKSDRMYSKSPSLKRDDNGEVGVSKPSMEDAEAANVGGDGSSAEMGSETPEAAAAPEAMQSHERHEMHHKHVAEKLQMHRRHELEHASGHGDPKKHTAEHKEMGERHQAEFEAMTKRQSKPSS